MNRPKKNKSTDPLLPEDNVVDERHLVDLEDAEELSFEDRVSMYWMENKGFVTGCILALVFVIAGYNGLRIYKEHSEQSLQKTFAAADAAGELESFAKEHASKDLGGFAAMMIADAAYKEADFAKALEFYQIAKSALADSILAGRAMIGEAFALYSKGDIEAGIAKLSSVAADTSIAESTRAEAAYHLAIEADMNGDSDAFQAYSTQITSSELAAPWQQRLSFYQQQVR